tara:strand:- start:40 stop:1458 length:1419 start_codon:yes stop_codon:yes gene_type:complete
MDNEKTPDKKAIEPQILTGIKRYWNNLIKDDVGTIALYKDFYATRFIDHIGERHKDTKPQIIYSNTEKDSTEGTLTLGHQLIDIKQILKKDDSEYVTALRTKSLKKKIVVSVLDGFELTSHEAADFHLGGDKNVNIEHIWIPVEDHDFTCDESLLTYQALHIALKIKEGHDVFMHCKSGKGRSGALAVIVNAALNQSKDISANDFKTALSDKINLQNMVEKISSKEYQIPRSLLNDDKKVELSSAVEDGPIKTALISANQVKEKRDVLSVDKKAKFQTIINCCAGVTAFCSKVKLNIQSKLANNKSNSISRADVNNDNASLSFSSDNDQPATVVADKAPDTTAAQVTGELDTKKTEQAEQLLTDYKFYEQVLNSIEYKTIIDQIRNYHSPTNDSFAILNVFKPSDKKQPRKIRQNASKELKLYMESQYNNGQKPETPALDKTFSTIFDLLKNKIFEYTQDKEVMKTHIRSPS